MATNSGKKARKEDPIVIESFREVKPLNDIQAEYLDSIRYNDIIFGIGSAGTGKTFIAAYFAAGQLFYRKIRKIILTRPNVEAGRSLGFLPGNLEEKYLPYLEPFDSVFTKALGKGFYEYALKEKAIDPRPLGFMRGVTFEDCIVLVDECQNLTVSEFKMLLTRIGKNCKIILSGDPTQLDINNSGLTSTIELLSHIDGVDVVRFSDDDIVRSKLCKQIIMAYHK